MTSLFEDHTLKTSPPHWSKCDRLLAAFTPPAKFGFTGKPGDINHFKSRYRLAKSFQGISLDTYSIATTEGYSAIFKIFLTWSAFEQFLKIIGLTRKGTTALIAKYNSDQVSTQIRSIPDYANFIRFVLERVNNEHKPQIQAFLDQNICDITYLASGIRHIFAHGTLTPHAGSNTPDPAKQVCPILVEFLFQIMDTEFSFRLESIQSPP